MRTKTYKAFLITLILIALASCGSDSKNESSTTTTTPADTAAPSVPVILSATPLTSSKAELKWVASTDNAGVSFYRVFRDGVFIQNSTSSSFADTGLTAGAQYCYKVSACDWAGNESQKSAEECAKTKDTDPNLAGNWECASETKDGTPVDYDVGDIMVLSSDGTGKKKEPGTGAWKNVFYWYIEAAGFITDIYEIYGQPYSGEPYTSAYIVNSTNLTLISNEVGHEYVYSWTKLP